MNKQLTSFPKTLIKLNNLCLLNITANKIEIIKIPKQLLYDIFLLTHLLNKNLKS
jgi:hypothetical protein